MDDNVEMACPTDHGMPRLANLATDDSSQPVRSPMKKRATELLRKISLFSISESEAVSPLTVLTIQQAVILISTILLIAVVLQIPTILYYTNEPPSSGTSSSLISDINFQTCSVS